MLKKTVKSTVLQDFDDDADSVKECEEVSNPEIEEQFSLISPNDDLDTTKSAKLPESNQLDETQVVNDFAMEIYDTLDLPNNMRT